MKTFWFFQLWFHWACDCLQLQFSIFTSVISSLMTPTSSPLQVKTSVNPFQLLSVRKTCTMCWPGKFVETFKVLPQHVGCTTLFPWSLYLISWCSRSHVIVMKPFDTTTDQRKETVHLSQSYNKSCYSLMTNRIRSRRSCYTFECLVMMFRAVIRGCNL